MDNDLAPDLTPLFIESRQEEAMPDDRKAKPWAPTYARILERQGNMILCEQIDQRYRDEAPALPFRWWTVRLTPTGDPNWATVQYHRLLIDGLVRLRGKAEEAP